MKLKKKSKLAKDVRKVQNDMGMLQKQAETLNVYTQLT